MTVYEDNIGCIMIIVFTNFEISSVSRSDLMGYDSKHFFPLMVIMAEPRRYADTAPPV